MPQDQIRWLVGWVSAMVASTGFMVQIIRLKLGKGSKKRIAFWAIAWATTFIAALFVMP